VTLTWHRVPGQPAVPFTRCSSSPAESLRPSFFAEQAAHIAEAGGGPSSVSAPGREPRQRVCGRPRNSAESMNSPSDGSAGVPAWSMRTARRSAVRRWCDRGGRRVVPRGRSRDLPRGCSASRGWNRSCAAKGRHRELARHLAARGSEGGLRHPTTRRLHPLGSRCVHCMPHQDWVRTTCRPPGRSARRTEPARPLWGHRACRSAQRKRRSTEHDRGPTSAPHFR
jgi:hypothetical protein